MIGIGRHGPFGPVGLVAGDHRTIEATGGAGSVWCDTEEREALGVLVSVAGLGPMTLARLVATIGSAREVIRVAQRPGAVARLAAAGRPDDGRPGGVTGDVATAIVDAANRVDELAAAIRAASVTILTLDDEAYPTRLRAIELPPVVLFVRGTIDALSARRAVAVVGTRSATNGGRQFASHLAATLAAAGATVVSGLAIGIDGAAHAGVVAVHGRTVAVLGGGHERLYPAAHARLASAIVDEGGAVVSEHAPLTSPTRWTFPRRNRIIAGLAEATVVVEAGRGSGAMTTAMWALEQGRGCFVVPGPIGAPSWAGCLELLRTYHGAARIVAGVAELLADLDLPDDAEEAATAPPTQRASTGAVVPSVAAVLLDLGPAARDVGRALVAGLATPDDLVAATDLPIATVLAALTILEGRGLATSAYGRYRPAGALAAASPPGRRQATRRRLPAVPPAGPVT